MPDNSFLTPILFIIGQLFIGFLSYLGVKKQIINSGITQFRQQWIDKYRNSVSELIALVDTINFHLSQIEKYDEKFQIYLNDFLVKKYFTLLLLDEDKNGHSEIINDIEEISLVLRNSTNPDSLYNNSNKVNAIKKSIILRSKGVILQEWQNVKKGT